MKKKDKKKEWSDLVHKAMVPERNSHKLFIVEGEPHLDARTLRPFMEPNRHIRKTLNGLVRQILRDPCMNDRHMRIYEIDLNSIKPIFEGRIKDDIL